MVCTKMLEVNDLVGRVGVERDGSSCSSITVSPTDRLLFYAPTVLPATGVTVMNNIIRVQRVIAIASMLGLGFCLVPVRSISAQDRTAPTFLLQRGDALLQLGDVSAARLLYARAAELGSGTAALELAKTYDPTFLTDHDLRGVKPDPVEATRWYQRAADMGLTQAKERLRNMDMNALAQKR